MLSRNNSKSGVFSYWILLLRDKEKGKKPQVCKNRPPSSPRRYNAPQVRRVNVALRFQVNSTHRPAPKLKSVGVQPFGFGKGWSLPQERNSASSSQKFANIKRSKTISPNTDKEKLNAPHKAANKKAACRKRNSRPAILHSQKRKCRASILHAALTENSRPPAGGYASVNRFARNGGRSQTDINPQNTAPTKPRNSSRTASQVKCFCSADTDSQVTYRRLSAVDRYIIAVRRCYRSIRRMQV